MTTEFRPWRKATAGTPRAQVARHVVVDLLTRGPMSAAELAAATKGVNVRQPEMRRAVQQLVRRALVVASDVDGARVYRLASRGTGRW